MNKKITFWSHRGYHKKKRANTIESLEEANDLGFRHIELDLWFLNGKFRLSHDKPRRGRIDKMTLLGEYLERFGNKINYWLDFKNLDKNNVKNALLVLKENLDKNKIPYKKIIFVPYEENMSRVPPILKSVIGCFSKIKFACIINKKVAKKYTLLELQDFYKKNKIKYLSVDSQFINKKFIEILGKKKIYAWVVDEEKELNRLKKLGVKNICTNERPFLSKIDKKS